MTAIAAAEKKKKKDEMYYKFNTSRGMGYWKSRMKNYDDAVKLYTIAIDNAEPGMETPLLIARSKAQSRLVNHEAARRDALAVTDPQPDNLRGLENDASTLYEKDDFEDSLVRNYCGFRKRKKPANFYSGILVGKETIEDCVGRNAGPCLDHERLGKVIVNMHMKPHRESEEMDALSQAKRKYEAKRIDRFFSQKYLGRLANDKQFLQDMLKLPDLKSGNKEHNQQLESLISHMIDNINRQQDMLKLPDVKSGNKEHNQQLKSLISHMIDSINQQQETLMTQRPMYMLKHHEPKFSQKYLERKKEEDGRWRNGVTKVIDRLLEEAKTLQKDRKIEDCMTTCERLRRFVECQPSSLLSETQKEKILDQLYEVLGTLFMDTKTLVPNWSEVDNERRIEFILYSQTDDPRFVDKVRQTYFPKIWNIKEAKRSLEARLAVSIHKIERAFLHHELSRCLFEEMSIERAYKAASAGFKVAKEAKDALWAFNLGFLTALAVLVEGNADDAKIALRETNINARKLERDDCAFFIQKVIKMTTEPNRLDYDHVDTAEEQEKHIVDMMPTPDLKLRAQAVIRRVAAAPARAKLVLKVPSSCRPATQGSSRRSMKVNTRAKRRTLYEVKSSRNQQQTQHWIPSRTDDLIDD